MISHIGLNNEEQWDDFRELDADDQKLVRGWTRGEGDGSGGQGSEDSGQPAMRFDDPVAEDETLSHFLSRPFLDADDDRVIEEMLDMKGPGGFTYRELGITVEQLRERQSERTERSEAPAEPMSVQPQVRRRTLRGRLDKRSKSIHHRILTDLGLSRAGYDISRAVKARGNNADALYSLLNQEINAFVGESAGSRSEWSAEVLDEAYQSLDQIGDEVSARIQVALEGEA